MDPSHLEFKIDGKDVSPETVPLSDLLELLANFEQAIEITAKGGDDFGKPSVSLVGIKEGSDTLTLRANDKALTAASKISKAISTRDCSLVPAAAEEHLRAIWRKAHSRQWSIGISNSTFSATILPADDLFTISRTKGTTSIAGRLLRVGGEKPPTAQVFRDDETRITVDLSGQAMAEELGQLLYKFVALEGEATWLVPSWDMEAFRATKILPATFANRDTTAVFKDLAVTSKSLWDDIDPDDFVRDQREDRT